MERLSDWVRDFTLGMVELGLGRGDVVGIIGDNRPDWVSAEIASHAIGAMSLVSIATCWMRKRLIC